MGGGGGDGGAGAGVGGGGGQEERDVNIIGSQHKTARQVHLAAVSTPLLLLLCQHYRLSTKQKREKGTYLRKAQQN